MLDTAGPCWRGDLPYQCHMGITCYVSTGSVTLARLIDPVLAAAWPGNGTLCLAAPCSQLSTSPNLPAYTPRAVTGRGAGVVSATVASQTYVHW